MKGLRRGVERLQCYDRMKNFWTCKKTSHCFHWEIVVYVSYSNYKIFGLCAVDYTLFIFIIYQKLLYYRAEQIALRLWKLGGGPLQRHVAEGCDSQQIGLIRSTLLLQGLNSARRTILAPRLVLEEIWGTVAPCLCSQVNKTHPQGLQPGPQSQSCQDTNPLTDHFAAIPRDKSIFLSAKGLWCFSSPCWWLQPCLFVIVFFLVLNVPEEK